MCCCRSFRSQHDMVRAAIIGLGRWGRSLVNAVHGKSDAIQFAAAYTRTRASAEDFCREKNIPLRDRFEDPRRPEHRRRGAGDAAQPARRAGDGRRRPPASTSTSRSRSRSTGRARRPRSRRPRSAGIVLAVGFNRRFHPSVVEIRKRLADGQLGQVMSMVGAAHHQHRAVHRRPTTGGRSPTRRRAAPSPRSACIRSTT